MRSFAQWPISPEEAYDKAIDKKNSPIFERTAVDASEE